MKIQKLATKENLGSMKIQKLATKENLKEIFC